MTTPDLLSYALVIMAVLVALYSARDVRRAPEYKKFLRAGAAVILLYYVVVYLYAVVGPDTYLIRSGIMGRLGTLAFISLLLMEIAANRSHQGRNRD